MQGSDDRILLRLRDPEWFVGAFTAIAERQCTAAGFVCVIDSTYLREAHAAWLVRCQRNPHRVSPSEPHFHYRTVGWLCAEIISTDYPLVLTRIRPIESELARMILAYPSIYLTLAVCSDIMVTVCYELDPSRKPISSPRPQTVWSACENLQDDPKQAVHFMQILCGDYASAASFL